MSFGFGVGDFIAVGKLAWSVYKSCKDAPESFKNISAEVLSLHAVLKEVEEALVEEPLTESKQRSLAEISEGCRTVLHQLQDLIIKYESLGSQSQRTWDRMRWGTNDFPELRARLTSNIMLLTTFLITSQVVVNRKLNRFVKEFREGKHEGSVISIATVDSLSPNEKETWRNIRKELENIGISVLAFDANRTFIMNWFQKAIRSGSFEEQMNDSDHASLDSNDPRSSNPSPFLSRAALQIGDVPLDTIEFGLETFGIQTDAQFDALNNPKKLRRSTSNERTMLRDENATHYSDQQTATRMSPTLNSLDQNTPKAQGTPRMARLRRLIDPVLGYVKGRRLDRKDRETSSTSSMECEIGDIARDQQLLLKDNDHSGLAQRTFQNRSIDVEVKNAIGFDKYNKYERVKALLANGAMLDWTAEHVDITDLLIDKSTSIEDVRVVGKGLNLGSISKRGLTPLDWAVRNRYFEIALQFIELGAKSRIDHWERSLRKLADDNGSSSLVARHEYQSTKNMIEGYEELESMFHDRQKHD